MRFLSSLTTNSLTQWLKDIRLFTLAGVSGTPIPAFALSVFSPRLRRRQIDQAVAQSEHLFAVFMDNLPGYAWMKDRAGRYLYVNQGVKSLAPYQNGWLGQTDAEIWPGKVGATFRQNDLKVIATGEKVETSESFVLNGEQRHVLVVKFPIFDGHGTVTMVGGTGVDITEHKRVEEQLSQAEEKYRSIFENAVEGIFQSTPDGRFVAANPALARMYGFDSPEELISTRTDIAQQLFVEPKSREEFKRSMEEKGFILDFELEAYRKDGSKIWISENVRAVRDQSGRVAYYEGTTQDITARKLAEQALRESEERYRELFENAKDGIYVHDMRGTYTSINRAIEKLSGYSREEILGKNFSGFVAPEYLEEVRENFGKKLRHEGETSYTVEIITKDGRSVPVEVNSNLIYENGSPVGVQALVRDITERRSAEQAIRQAEQKFRGIFENAGEGIFQTTPDGRYIAANPALARMHGFDSPEELIGDRNDISRQVYVDPTRREEFKRLLEANGAVRGFEHEVFRKDGSRIWITVNARAVRDDQRQTLYYEGTAQDITERKRVEEALKNYSRLLIKAQETERQNIARELHDQTGQLLTAIRINLQAIRDSSKMARQKSLTDEGITLVDYALDQVRDLSFELRPSLLDDLGLIAAFRWYADRYTQRTGIKTRSVIKLAGKRLPLELETACFRIIQEAFTNVHAGAKKVVINLRMLKEEICLSIKDNGCGFDSGSINSRSVPIRLGLRGMEERALALGGRLEIESVLAKGTEIRAYFPNEEYECW